MKKTNKIRRTKGSENKTKNKSILYTTDDDVMMAVEATSDVYMYNLISTYIIGG